MKKILIFSTFLFSIQSFSAGIGVVSGQIARFSIRPDIKTCFIFVEASLPRKLRKANAVFETRDNRTYGLVVPIQTCQDQDSHLKEMMASGVTFSFASFKKIGTHGLNRSINEEADRRIREYREENSEAIFGDFPNLGALQTIPPLSGKITRVVEGLNPKIKSTEVTLFGRNAICVVMLSMAAGDRLGVVMDQAVCDHNGYGSMINQAVSVNPGNLDYLTSSNQIGAMKALDKNLFYKSLAAHATALGSGRIASWINATEGH